VKVARFINAHRSKQVIFTRNTTESINLVAYSWGNSNITAGDLIVLTEMEHHSNLVPWQLLAQRTGARLEFVPVTDEGLLNQDIYKQLLQQQPKLVAFTHMSNVLGTINPAQKMIALAHAAGAIVYPTQRKLFPTRREVLRIPMADSRGLCYIKCLEPLAYVSLYVNLDWRD